MAMNMKESRKILIGLAAVVLIIMGIFVARYYMKVPVLTQTQLFEIKAATVTGQLREDITLNAGTTTDFAFENAGKITNVLVAVGDSVKRGQLLAEEKSSDYVVALNEKIAEKAALDSQVDAADENVKVQKAKLQGLYKEKGLNMTKKLRKKRLTKQKQKLKRKNRFATLPLKQLMEHNLILRKHDLLLRRTV